MIKTINSGKCLFDPNRQRVKRKIEKIAFLFLESLGLLLVFIVFFLPIAWIFLTSFKTEVDTYNLSLFFTPTLDNYKTLFVHPFNFGLYFFNSASIVIVTLLISIPLSMSAAYALSRFHVFGKQPLLFLILSTQFLPPVLLVLPFFIMFRNMGILDTVIAMVIVNVGRSIPFAIWLIKGFVDGIPDDIEQAAMIDGCSRFQVLWHIILPLIKPGVLTATVFCFVVIWNEFLYALILSREVAITLPMSLMLFWGERGVVWNQMAAGGILIVLPTVVIMLLARKHFVKGLTLGAID